MKRFVSKAKRKYTPEERAAYHSNRMRTRSYPSNKKFYSQSWLEGYMETSRVETLLDEVQATINYRKSNGSLTKERKTDLYGYRAGLRARLEKEKQANRLRQPDKVQR